MLRGFDAQSSKFLADMDRLNTRMAGAQRQISSGKRINSVSDAPDDVSVLLATRSELSAVEQAQRNLNLVKTEVDSAEQVLGLSVSALDRVLSLGAQGASDTMSADSRHVLSLEIASILDQLVNFSGTQVNGRHLFAGDLDQATPYSLDTNLLANPINREDLLADADPLNDDADLYEVNQVMLDYQGSTSTRQVQHPRGQRFGLAFTAQEIFDDPDPAKNVFQAVNNLRIALHLNDRGNIEKALGQVRGASEHLTMRQSSYGAIQNRIAEGLDVAAKQSLALRSQIASVEDADISSAILELTESRYQQEAAYAAEAKRPRTSLFDYLR